uniref:DOP1 leucine zipper like protein B n=1 Tax=Oncorhynchus kisutch TaxID=8019 RepID=A0A8C7CH99_ONCKI
MDPEEQELQNDYRYRSYAAVIEKALRNFESSSEWADLISSLGKLNKALQSNLRYSLLPKRLIIGKRLAQCLHPALPSGVHIKALETYEVIFKIIGTKWLAKDLFIYSSGLFPLLGHAAMAVKPALLTLYERYYLPLQRALLPSLQAFITGLLPGLEEGAEVYDRTDALLLRLSMLVGQQVFYGALWGSVLVSPLVRLPASLFIVTHFDRLTPPHQQTRMLGYDNRLVVKALCLSLQDSNVLVQRNMLEILLFFFSLATCLDTIRVVSAASLTLLRRDMSLNRRLYAWLLGSLVWIDMHHGPLIVGSVLLEVVRAFYSYCREMLGEESITSTGLTGNQLASKIKENKNASEIIKTVNMLVSSMNSEFLWDYITCHFCTSDLSLCLCLHSDPADLPPPPLQYHSDSPAPSVTEISTLIIFLLDVIPLELHADIQSQFLPQMLGRMLHALRTHMTCLDLSELTQGLRTCFKVLSKIQMPVTYMDMEVESESQSQKVKSPTQEESLQFVPVSGCVSITTTQIKDKLAELFTPNKHKPRSISDPPVPDLPVPPTEKKKGRVGTGGGVDWGAGYMPRGRAEISEECRQAFTAACHLLLECTTFPLYLSEEESQVLYSDIDVGCLPLWLRSLMTLCCLSRDYQVQHTAVSSLLELINHSQSLALVIQDKTRRYQASNANPLSGRLQMVTVPPIYPGLLSAIEQSTDFYQRVAQVLWGQLDVERREQHTSCVALFYRLHCLAPSASICEDIVCQALLHRDKAVRLEALHRFSVLWHLTRENQSNRTMSLNRSFDRSLCVVVDCLNSPDGSVSAAAQCWLVRALSLQDVVRILEPVLLLLLHPSTQRCTIQSVKQNLTAGNLKDLNSRSRSTTKGSTGAMATSTQPDEGTLGHMILVDREALWGELERDPETTNPAADSTGVSCSESEATEGEDELEEEEEEESEHTESADTSGAQVSTENSSSATYGCSVEEGGVVSCLRRVESEHTQVSDSLSSEEDDLEREAMAQSRLLKQEREKREVIDSLFRHVLLYSMPGGWPRLLHGLALLDSLLRSSAQRPLVDALSSTSLDTSSAAHLNLVSNLLQRHQQAQDGRGFHGRLLSPTSSPSIPPSLLIELLVSLCLRFLHSHYPSYLTLGPRELQGNREVQVKSVGVLTRLVTQLGCVVWGQRDSSTLQEAGVGPEAIRKLLARCKVQQYALLTLSASMYISQKGVEKDSALGGLNLFDEQVGLSEESLVNLGGEGGQEQYPLQMELLKLLQALIVLEYYVWPGGSGSTPHPDEPRDTPVATPASSAMKQEWQTGVLFQQSIKAAQYVQTQPITAQGMFVSAAARALQPQYGYAMHPHWVALLCSSLPYLGRSLGIIVAPLITQICRNLDELVKQYDHDGGKATQSSRKENVAPDYPLTLLEGLTTLTHHCLLDNKKVSRARAHTLTQKILEAVGGVAGSSLEQTSWLSRNLEVKNQPQVCPETEDTMVSSSAPSVYSVQALALLAEVLAPLLDMVYRSDEKEKAVPLISRLMYYVFPYLKNHSAYNMPSFGAGAQLLSNLSGYAYTKRAWKKEAFELYMDPLFFTMDVSCAPHWRAIIDHLLTHEKTMFKDLMSMQSSSLKLFPSAEQKPMLLKRQAFAMFSGELDQYHLYLVCQSCLLMVSLIFVCQIHTFVRLEKALSEEKEVSKLTKVVRGSMGIGPLTFPQPELDMYLSACKFLDTALAFPPEKMPLFQMYRWAFVPEVDMSRYSGPENGLLEGELECKPHVVKVLEALHQRYGVRECKHHYRSSTERLEIPLLTHRSLSSITQLVPFLHTLCCSFQGTPPSSPADYPVADYPTASAHQVLKRLEHITEGEFLDSMES